MEIDLGRLDGFVTEPERDDGATDTFVQKLHRRGVAQTVGAHMLALEGRTALGRQSGVFLDDALDRVTAETTVAVAHEQWPIGGVGPLVKPSAEYRHRVRPEWCRAILAPLARRDRNDAAPSVLGMLDVQDGRVEIDIRIVEPDTSRARNRT